MAENERSPCGSGKVRWKRLTKRSLCRQSTLLSSGRHNRRCAITVEYLLMDSAIRASSPNVLENVTCQSQKIPGSGAGRRDKRENYDFHDSNYRRSIYGALNEHHRPMCFIPEGVRSARNLAGAERPRDKSRVCFFPRTFADTVAKRSRGRLMLSRTRRASCNRNPIVGSVYDTTSESDTWKKQKNLERNRRDESSRKASRNAKSEMRSFAYPMIHNSISKICLRTTHTLRAIFQRTTLFSKSRSNSLISRELATTV